MARDVAPLFDDEQVRLALAYRRSLASSAQHSMACGYPCVY